MIRNFLLTANLNLFFSNLKPIDYIKFKNTCIETKASNFTASAYVRPLSSMVSAGRKWHILMQVLKQFASAMTSCRQNTVNTSTKSMCTCLGFLPPDHTHTWTTAQKAKLERTFFLFFPELFPELICYTAAVSYAYEKNIKMFGFCFSWSLLFVWWGVFWCVVVFCV